MQWYSPSYCGEELSHYPTQQGWSDWFSPSVSVWGSPSVCACVSQSVSACMCKHPLFYTKLIVMVSVARPREIFLSPLRSYLLQSILEYLFCHSQVILRAMFHNCSWSVALATWLVYTRARASTSALASFGFGQAFFMLVWHNVFRPLLMYADLSQASTWFVVTSMGRWHLCPAFHRCLCMICGDWCMGAEWSRMLTCHVEFCY